VFGVDGIVGTISMMVITFLIMFPVLFVFFGEDFTDEMVLLWNLVRDKK
jgi:hypothetical protein